MVARCHANALLHSAKDCPRLDSHCHSIAIQSLRCSKQDFAAAIQNFTVPLPRFTTQCLCITKPCIALPLPAPRITVPRHALPPQHSAVPCVAATALDLASPKLHLARPRQNSTPQSYHFACVRSDAPNGDNLPPEHLQRGQCRELRHSSPTMRRTSSSATSRKRRLRLSFSRSRSSAGMLPRTIAPHTTWTVFPPVSGSAP